MEEQRIEEQIIDNQDVSTTRRKLLKALTSLPVLGVFSYGFLKKLEMVESEKKVSDVFNLNRKINHRTTNNNIENSNIENKQIRLGVIGYGSRGRSLMRAAGYADSELIEEWIASAKENKNDSRYEDFLKQPGLNVTISAICDIFDYNADWGIQAATNINRTGFNGNFGSKPKRYKNYKDLIASQDVDAVIIATPDFWHAPMSIEAAKAGKHVYCEKPATWTFNETLELRKVIKESGIIYQLGHQGRQTDSYNKAKDIIEKGILGHISLIEVCTNRNDPNGAWVKPVHPKANIDTIDWRQFIPPKASKAEYENYMREHKLQTLMCPVPYNQFDAERFFRWRCWWDYSTGMIGDLLTHEFDVINQIMKIGIPDSATSSGGIYFFKDGRTVPDTLQTCFEYHKKDLTLLYSATQSNSKIRDKLIMGHDGTMVLNDTLELYIDKNSTQHSDKIKSGIINTEEPVYNFIPGNNGVDAVSSATEMYFAKRGLMYTYIDGVKYDTSFLHMREWIQCIRQNKQPSCGIDEAFEAAVAIQMAARSYLEKRTVYWDSTNEKII